MKSTAIQRQPFGAKKPKALDPDLRIAGKPWPASWMSEKDWQATVEDYAYHFGWTKAFNGGQSPLSP